jgi:prephenate dehydrogenase
VTSLHPMFGPDTELLSGRHVIFIDLGNAEALSEAQRCSRRRWRNASSWASTSTID